MSLSVPRVTALPHTSFLLKDKLTVKRIAGKVCRLRSHYLNRHRNATIFLKASTEVEFLQLTFQRFLTPSCLGANTAKIAVNVWETLKVRCPISWKWLTFWVFYEIQGKDTQQKVFWSNLKIIDLLSGEELHSQLFLKCLQIFPRIATRVFRQMYGKMKTLIVAFLARLFPSNAISKFFYLVSLVLNS